jgi:hypothetical protein
MRWLRVVSMSIVVILTAFVLYYVFYLGTQEAGQHARNLRGLGSIAGRIEGRLDNVVGVLRNAPYKVGVPECQGIANLEKYASCRAEAHLQSIPWLDFVSLELVDTPAESVPWIRTGTSYLPIHRGADFGLRLTSLEDGEDKSFREYEDKSELQVELVAETTLERAFPRLDYEGLFDELLIVDESGAVILQRGRRLIRFTGIDDLLLDPDGSEDADELQAGRGSSNRHQVVIGGEAYHLYVHRMQLDLHARKGVDGQGQSTPARWLVAGLVAEERFRSSTHVISSLSLLSLIFALTLGVLIAPVLKLWLLGPKERLRREDVWLFGIGSIAAVGVVTIAYLDLWDYARVRAHYADELREVAQEIDEDVRLEINDMLCQMTHSARETDLVNWLEYDEKTADLLGDLNEYASLRQLILIDPTGTQRVKLTRSKDSAGRLKITPFIRVADREYFRGTSKGDFTTIDFEMSCSDHRRQKVSFVLESIRSRNNDTKISTLGIRAGEATRCSGCEREAESESESGADTAQQKAPEKAKREARCAQCACVQENKGCAVVIGSTFFGALRAPILPAGFGFAIIDHTGRVLYHDEEQRILEENLLAEISNPQLLEWTARSNAGREKPTPINLRYRGAAHQLIVRELSAIDAPWRLVVYRDIELAGRVNFKAITTSLIWFAGGLLCVCVIMWLGLLAYGSDRATWFWPREDGHIVYWPLARTLFVIAMAFQAAMISLRGRDGLALMTCMPALAMAMTLYELERSDTKGARRVHTLSIAVALVASAGVLALMMRATGQVASFALAATLFATGWRLVPELWRTRALGGPGHPWLGTLSYDRPHTPGSAARSSQRGYFAVMILLVMIGGALPAVAIYWDARDAGFEDLLHMEQHSFARALTRRSLSLGAKDNLLERWQLGRELPINATGRRPRRPAGVHLASHLDFDPKIDGTWATLSFAPHHSGTPYFTRMGPVVLPIGTSASMLPQNRESLPRKIETQHWADREHEYAMYRDIRDPEPVVHLLGQREKIRSELPWKMYALLNGLALLILAAMWHGSRSFSHRLLGLGETLYPAVDSRADSALGPLRLHVQPSDEKLRDVREEAAQGWICDLRSQSSARWRNIWDQFEREIGKQRIVLDHFELAIIDPILGRDVLSLLEKLAFDFDHKQIDLLCAVEPLPLLDDRSGGKGDGQLYSAREIERWAQLLTHFDRHRERARCSPLELPTQPEDQVAILRRELEWDPELRRASGPLAALLGTVPTQSFQQIVWDRCAPRYREIWSLCTQRDRRTLLYIAEEGFPSPDGWESVRCLEARGLVARTPHCHIMGPGFEQMIRSSIPAAERKALEGGDEPSTWSIVRTPFLLLLLIAALFLFATQRELFNVGMGAAAGAAITLPALMRMAGTVWLGKGGSSGTA